MWMVSEIMTVKVVLWLHTQMHMHTEEHTLTHTYTHSHIHWVMDVGIGLHFLRSQWEAL